MIKVNEVLADIEPFMKLQVEEYQAALTLRQDSKSLKIWGDKTLIGQVLLNLVGNGLQAMQGNGADHRQLAIEIAPLDEDFIQFSVRDNGVGMEKGQLEALFHSRASSKPDHFGIGLILSRSIITSHSGQMRVESEPGVGTSVIFTLRRKSQRRFRF